MQKLDQRIGATINLIKLPLNNIFEFNFDQDTDWVKAILVELNENATEETPEEYLKTTSLSVSGQIIKKQKTELGEYVLLTANISANYVTECVRTLKTMTVELEVPVRICFIDEELAETELFTDADDTYVDNEMWDLYFYNKRSIEFKDVIHEQVFLNYEQYPILDADSPLDIGENKVN